MEVLQHVIDPFVHVGKLREVVSVWPLSRKALTVGEADYLTQQTVELVEMLSRGPGLFLSQRREPLPAQRGSEPAKYHGAVEPEREQTTMVAKCSAHPRNASKGVVCPRLYRVHSCRRSHSH